MKRSLLRILVVIFASCASQKNSVKKLLVHKDFNQTEASEINKLVNYFETGIKKPQTNLNSSYLRFFQYTALRPDSISNVLFDKAELKQHLNKLSKTTKNELWVTSKTTAYRSYDGVKFDEPIIYNSFSINTSGKYLALLKSLSDKDVKTYVNRILAAGDLPSSFIFRSLIIDYDEQRTVDFKADYWRIIITIQYLSDLNEYYTYSELFN